MNRFDVDTAKQETSLEEAARKCGIQLDVKRQSGTNVRVDCPFGCPGDHVGKQEISVSTEGDKLFRCHSYGCGFRGNLLKLMHGWLTATMPPGGNLKGSDFNRVKNVLQDQSAQTRAATPIATAAVSTREATVDDAPPKRNLPLSDSDNAKARELVGLEELFVIDPAEMKPTASRYWRERRHYLTAAQCKEWGVGIRPTKNEGDKRGWSLRGQVCYRFLSEDNKPLCFVGRDPEYETKLATFESLSPEQRQAQKLKAPVKHRFPSGFHRGLELYGQHSDRLSQHPEYREFIEQHGVIVVEGFNDVLALDQLGVPAVAICSNRITDQQAGKVVRWARALGGSKVSLMFDCENTGDEGAKEALWLFAQSAPDLDVRLAWSQSMYAGQFRGRQPESATENEVTDVILPALKRSC
jgi:hypothetical protein